MIEDTELLVTRRYALPNDSEALRNDGDQVLVWLGYAPDPITMRGWAMMQHPGATHFAPIPGRILPAMVREILGLTEADASELIGAAPEGLRERLAEKLLGAPQKAAVG